MTSTLAPPPPAEPAGRPAVTPPPAPTASRRGQPRARLSRLGRGRAEDPRWARPALLGLLASTAVLYLWGLGASGWANSFYSAAAQAGATSWKAMFFGSSDAASFITVDKIPGALWIMSLSVRLFGLNSWSILVPQALEGVAAVGVLHATVRRWFGPAAGLLAGAAMALTPVATLMFRFNNPDALLVLLLTMSAYALVRALESVQSSWVVAAFSLVGFAFLAKMLQAFLVVPAFGLVYLLAAPTSLRRRVGQLTAGAGALLVGGGWWVAIVELWPKSSRPYIGGSQNNSVLNLLFGYNGIGRLSGSETGSVGGATTASGRWGPTGLGRLFNTSWGGQASWLLPAALLLLVAGVAARGGAGRTDRPRAALLLWGGWLLSTAAVFSFSRGIIHEYYSVALVPAIGALVGIGATTWWRRRHEAAARVLLSVVLLATAAWSAHLLGRTPAWLPALRGTIFAVGLLGAGALLVAHRLPRPARAALAVVALGVALAGPAAGSVSTARTTHSGAIPTAGPASGRGGFGGGPGGFGAAGRPPLAAGGLPPIGGGPPPAGAGGPGAGGRGAGGPGGGLGGLLGSTTPAAAVTTTLQHAGTTWAAAAVGSNQAAGYQLASGKPVMAIGGFNGSDPTPTLAQFEALVAQGRVRYFIGGGGGPGGAGQASSSSTAITAWVTSTFKPTTVGGTTLYDLTVRA